MSKLFRNSSPGALTLQQSIELEKKRLAASKSQKGAGRAVDDEPRVPQGHGRESGEWTREGASPAVDGGRAVASDSGETVTITHPDGTTEVCQGGKRPWRCNNPGAIVNSPFAKRHGAVGKNGNLAIFPDEATGEAALEALLNGPSYSSLTIDEAVARRTKDKVDGNNTAQTQKLVRQFSGLRGDAIISQLGPDEKQRLYGAIQRSEGWSSGSVTKSSPP